MLRKIMIFAVLLGGGGFGVFWFITAPQAVAAATLPSYAPDLANGKVMFYAGGCASCHAVPKQDDKTKLGGGLEMRTPFGTFHVPNISPDPKDGIGAWTESDFISAVQRGTSPDGQHYYPAFPYGSYAHMRQDDVRDLFAYLKTLPPVAGRVRDHDLSFPFNIRRAVGVWKALFFDDTPFTPDAVQNAQWNRGAYLVNGPGHCAECHSPRNLLGGIVASQRFAGGPNPDGDGWVPNITQAGIAEWSASDIAYMLESGQTPDGDFVGSSMTAVTRNTEQLPAEDRAAIAAYIKSLPVVEGPKKPPKSAQSSETP